MPLSSQCFCSRRWTVGCEDGRICVRRGEHSDALHAPCLAPARAGAPWLSVESRRVALATIATPSRADAPRRRPVAAVRHATAAEASTTHWAGRQKARAALASATRLMSESDRASFAAFDVEFVVEISRCRAPLHRSTTQALRPAADVELYSSTLLYSAPECSTSLQLYSALHSTSSTPSLRRLGLGTRM